MINRNQSLRINLVISINLKRNDSFLVPDDSLSKTSIIVEKTDQVASVFEAIGFPNRKDKIVFNGQVLCPTLSFEFYNIHNNDTISLISPRIPISVSINDLSLNDHVIIVAPRPLPISHKRTLHHSNSSNYFKKINNLFIENVNDKENIQNNEELIKTTKIEEIHIN